ncbi:hypothetical protein B0A53_02300 [Rhodotorula sp. CCFEE 5036]|nr:hypothetical protein B0A53_02300 [Rhodotorula sp. CCFEE 5036]
MVRLDALESAQRAASPTPDRPPRTKRQRTDKLPSAADLYVDKLPGLPPDARLQLFAGNIPAASSSPTAPVASDSDAHLYFLLARNKHIPKRERLVLWLNGGPGCSSFDGSLVELGPVRVNEDETLRVVEGTAWNEYANVLFFVPETLAGTLFEAGADLPDRGQVTKNDDVHELDTAAQQVVNFLANFYRIFPEFATMDTYIAGESYAGQYIPYIADAIEKTTIIGTPLKGLMIGSGWISPREQYPAYLSYLEQNELVDTSSESYNALQRTVAACERKLTHLASKGGKGMVLVSDCEKILGAMSRATSKDGKCLNSYDTREYIPCGQEWPPDMPQVTRYLRRPDVIKALHARDGTRDGKEWSQCSAAVGARFWTPQSVPSVYLLPGLLEKMPILLFNGDADLMCAGVGVERMIENLEWNGLKGFNDSETYDWFVNGKSAGRWTTARNLTYVSVYNSSHMVPMDQPAASHDMLLRFLQVDTMHSAGSAAVIPSRIGSEIETVLGATHPNGTSLSDLLKLASGGLTDPDELGTGSTEGGGGGGIVIGGGGGDDIEHERKYGPRKTAALVVLLLLLGGAVWAILHWRRHRRRERYRRLKGKGRAGPRSHRRREEEEEDEEEEEQVGLRTRRAAAASEPIPTIAVFDVGEYEDDMRSDGAEGGGGRDDERKRSSSGVRRSGGRGGGRSSLGDDDDDDERGDRAGDLGRAAEDANPFREDARRRYEKSMRS